MSRIADRDGIPAADSALSGDDLARGTGRELRLFQRNLAGVHRPKVGAGDGGGLGGGRSSGGLRAVCRSLPGPLSPARSVQHGISPSPFRWGDRWISDWGVPFTDDAGTFAGFIGSCVDVDERRRAQDAQQQRNQEQLALARDFERWILAIVSHDIRDPLGHHSVRRPAASGQRRPGRGRKEARRHCRTWRAAHPAHRRRSARSRPRARRRRHSDRAANLPICVRCAGR